MARAYSAVGRILLLLRRMLKGILLAFVVYVFVVLVGLIPVNNDYVPSEDGIDVRLISSPVHADVVLPIETEAVNWRDQFPMNCFQANTAGATHVAIGWGDKGFFLRTPNWSDVRVSTAAYALCWPSDSCMHVTLINDKMLGDHGTSVRLSEAEYRRLVEHIKMSFQTDEAGNFMQISGASYGFSDAFFEARGTYHCLNTCNSWIGRAIKKAGVRTAWITPLPKTMLLYLTEP